MYVGTITHLPMSHTYLSSHQVKPSRPPVLSPPSTSSRITPHTSSFPIFTSRPSHVLHVTPHPSHLTPSLPTLDPESIGTKYYTFTRGTHKHSHTRTQTEGLAPPSISDQLWWEQTFHYLQTLYLPLSTSFPPSLTPSFQVSQHTHQY